MTNTGNVALTGVVVVDDQLGTLTLQSGDTDNDFFNDTATTEIYTYAIFPYTTLFRSTPIR